MNHKSCVDSSRKEFKLFVVIASLFLLIGCASSNLFQSVKNGDIESTRRLLNDTNLNSRSLTVNGKPTALHLAAINGRTEIVKLLLKKNAMVDVKNDHDWTPLMYSALKGYYSISEMLVEAGANVNINDKNKGFTPLYIAADNGRIKTVKLLIENGADVNSSGVVRNYTALLAATQRGYINIVKTLIDKGARIDAADVNGITPLMIAADHGYPNLVDTLLSNGAKLNARDKFGRTPFFFVGYSGNEKLAHNLLSQGAEFNKLDDQPSNVYGTAMAYWNSAQFQRNHGDGKKAIEYYQLSHLYFEESIPLLKKHNLKTDSLLAAAKTIGKYSDGHAGVVAMQQERARHQRMAKIAQDFMERTQREIETLKSQL